MPVGFNAIDIARIEAGLIVFEYEYEPGQRTPFDLGLDRMVSFAPGARATWASLRCRRSPNTLRAVSRPCASSQVIFQSQDRT